MTQARVFETYHVDDPDVLYNKGDQWQIPENVSLDDNGPMSAFYVIMRLPGGEKEEFLLILPFTPEHAAEHDLVARGALGRRRLRRVGGLPVQRGHDASSARRRSRRRSTRTRRSRRSARSGTSRARA